MATAPDPQRTPVIVGVGEVTERLTQPGQAGSEAAALILAAARAALDDAGAAAATPIDAVHIVCQWSWKYRDLPGLVARGLGLAPERVTEGPVGGNMPMKLLGDIAVEIAQGRLQTAVICGGEATASKAAAAKSGGPTGWTPEDPAVDRAGVASFTRAAALKHGFKQPVDVYPLYENACRERWGESFEQAQGESARIGVTMALAAAANPHAWLPGSYGADDIATASPKNRMVSHPYTKLMVANPMVNQAAAVVVTTLARARAADIPEERIVYVWSGAGGSEPRDFTARDRYDHAPALDAVLRRTMAANGLQAQDLGLVEAYSCFPIVPKLARRSLGIADELPLSVAGGLVFFGAPVNNYMTHALTAMVRAMRGGSGRRVVGLLHANGEFLTKHHAIVIATAAPPAGCPIVNLNLQPELDAAYGEVPPFLEVHEGPSAIETYTATYGRDGTPERGLLVCRTPEGKRHVAIVPADDAHTLAWLVGAGSRPIGAPGIASLGEDGLVRWTLAAAPAS